MKSLNANLGVKMFVAVGTDGVLDFLYTLDDDVAEIENFKVDCADYAEVLEFSKGSDICKVIKDGIMNMAFDYCSFEDYRIIEEFINLLEVR